MDNIDVLNKMSSITEKIYDDALKQPITTVSYAITDLLKFVVLPFSFLGMTSDELLKKYETFLRKSISKVPSDKIIAPQPLIITKIFEDVKFVFYDDVIQEMFSNLLASSLNKDTYNDIHISFVNIIAQLDSTDAKLFKEIHDREIFPISDIYFTNGTAKEKLFSNLCCYKNTSGTKLSISIVNLLRLGLIEILDSDQQTDIIYDDIKETEEFRRLDIIYKEVKRKMPQYNSFYIEIKQRKVSFTTLGEVFSNYVL